ncbi:MAG: DUF3108 domain-containing protein [Gammaproteobacteria bacterium]
MRLSLLAGSMALAIVASAAHADTAATAASAPASVSATAALPAVLGIPPFSMHYDVLHGSLKVGEATFTLDRNNDEWLFAWRAHPVGLASVFVHSLYSETSRFSMARDLIRPLAYSYNDSGHADRDEKINFDWSAGYALDANDGNRKKIELIPGILDRMSSQLAVSRRLASGLTLPTAYKVINGGRIRTYTFQELRRETVTTPAGKFDTVVIERTDSDSDKTLVFWFAPKYAWLPVRIEQHEPGETTDTSILTHLKWLQTSPPAAVSRQ